MHLLTVINQERPHIITLLVPAHGMKGRIKVSHNLIFWEWYLKLGWDKGYEILLKMVQLHCHVLHFWWCWKGTGSSGPCEPVIPRPTRRWWYRFCGFLHPPTTVLHQLNDPYNFYHTKEIKTEDGHCPLKAIRTIQKPNFILPCLY